MSDEQREVRRLLRLAEDCFHRANGFSDEQYAFDQLERAKAYLERAQEVLIPVATLVGAI